jgi:hypothetical protein
MVTVEHAQPSKTGGGAATKPGVRQTSERTPSLLGTPVLQKQKGTLAEHRPRRIK